MKSNFSYDLYRSEGNRSKLLKVRLRKILFTPGCTFLFLFRHASESKNIISRFLWLFLLHCTKIVTGIQIPVGTQIDRGMRILHFGNIVINPSTIIGKNFNFAQGCLIGCSEGKNKGTPIIGDNCYMAANSIVVGG